MKLRFFFIVCFLLLSINSYSQITFKTEYFGASSYWLDKGNDKREKIGNSRGSAMVYSGSVNLPLSVKINENKQPTIWGVGLGGSYTSLNNKNFTDDLVISNILNLNLGLLHMRPISKKWSFMATLGVGIYSSIASFSKIGAKQILGSMATVFICQVRPNLQLGGGVAINSTFGYPMAFPALYLNWTLNGRFDFKLSMTNGLAVSAGFEFGKAFSLSLIGEMNGQTALLKKDGKDKIFTHQYIVTGLRPEIKISKMLSIPITIGINAVRPAYFSDRTLKAMFKSGNDYYFRLSPYASAGITINFF